MLKKIEGVFRLWLEELLEKPRSPRARLGADPVAPSRPPITPIMFTDDEVTRPTPLPAVLARADWLAQQPCEEDYELLDISEPGAPRATEDYELLDISEPGAPRATVLDE